MDVKKFKEELINIYKKYPIFADVINNSDENYIEFLYFHLNDDICLKITNDKFRGTYLKKITINPEKNYCNSILKIYNHQLTSDEKILLEQNIEFNIFIYNKKYPDINDKSYFYFKNRRDFLIPCFLNKNTINFLELVNITNIDNYKNNNKFFFITLSKIRQFVKTKERLGTMIDGSATLSIYDVRKMKDLDLIIFHPRYYDPKIRYNLIGIHKQLQFIDPYFYNFLSWEGEEKPILDKQMTKITNNKYNDFFYFIFNPEFSFYFYGIKVTELYHNLKYRAMRNYPKNIADIIITKYKLNIDVPKIKKLEDKVNANDEKMYDKKKFVDTIVNYLKKFNFKTDIDISKELEELST